MTRRKANQLKNDKVARKVFNDDKYFLPNTLRAKNAIA